MARDVGPRGRILVCNRYASVQVPAMAVAKRELAGVLANMIVGVVHPKVPLAGPSAVVARSDGIVPVVVASLLPVSEGYLPQVAVAEALVEDCCHNKMKHSDPPKETLPTPMMHKPRVVAKDHHQVQGYGYEHHHLEDLVLAVANFPILTAFADSDCMFVVDLHLEDRSLRQTAWFHVKCTVAEKHTHTLIVAAYTGQAAHSLRSSPHFRQGRYELTL